MNYRHAFHAGGFADVIKHIVLVRILLYLQDKQAPFRVIDSHAGAGIYDLTGDEAHRSGEWLTGIARLMQARFSETTLPLVTPYLDIVRAFNPQRDLKAYPGSPLIARALLRPQDRLTACEVEPKARKRLIEALRRDTQARVVDLDGWVALPAFVPPKERRGLVLIDPALRTEGRVRTDGRGLRTGLREMADRQLPAVVSGEKPARHRQPGAACRRNSRRRRSPRKMPAPGIQRRTADRLGRPDLGGSADRQSAVDAGRRAEDNPSRTRKAPWPGRRRPVQAGDAKILRLETCLGRVPWSGRAAKSRFRP
jgi:23S rRNA A2030 N6-methylase RlmJ